MDSYILIDNMGGCISQKSKSLKEEHFYTKPKSPDLIYFKSDAFLLFIAQNLHSSSIIRMNKLKKALPFRSMFYHFKDQQVISVGGIDRSTQQEVTTVYTATVKENRIDFKAPMLAPIYAGIIHYYRGKLILSGGSLNFVQQIEEEAPFPFAAQVRKGPRWDVSVGMSPAPIYEYLLSHETWQEVQISYSGSNPPIEPYHIFCPGTCVLNGKLFLIGGVTADSSGEIFNNDYILQYDLETKLYKVNHTRFKLHMCINMRCVAIDEKRILILGGYCIASGEKLVCKRAYIYTIDKGIGELASLEWDLDLSDRIAPYVSNGYAVFFAFPRVLLYEIESGKFSVFDFRDKTDESETANNKI